jgi:hypothetical protein
MFRLLYIIIIILSFSNLAFAHDVMDECSKAYVSQLDMSNCLANKAKIKDQEMRNKLTWLNYRLENILQQDYKDKADRQTTKEDKEYITQQKIFMQKATQNFLAYRNMICQGIVNSYPGASFQYSGTMYYWCQYLLTNSFLTNLEKLYFPDDWQSEYKQYRRKNHGHAM